MSPASVSMPQASVFVIEAQPFFRLGLIQFLESVPEFQILGQAGGSRGAVDRVLKTEPKLVILNISFPDGNGLEIVKNLRSTGFKGYILILTQHDENLYAERSLRAGANGYATKIMEPEKVLEAIRTVLAGEVFVSPDLNAKLLRTMAGAPSEDTPDRVSLLTDREFQVLELIGLGLKTSEIARRLGVSSKTIDVHRGNIKRKLAIDDLNELIRFAVQWLENR